MVRSSKDWRVAGYADWITMHRESGKSDSEFKFTVAPNDKAEDKVVELKIFSGSEVKTLTVKSQAKVVIELGRYNSSKLPSAESEFLIPIITNVDLEVSYENGGEKWLQNTELISDFPGKLLYRFVAEKSDEYKERKSAVVFKAVGSDEILKVNIEQAKQDTVFAKQGTKIIKDLDAFDLELQICSNVDFQYELPAWIHLIEKKEGTKDEMSGLTSLFLKIHVDKTDDSRGDDIEFIAGEGYDLYEVGHLYIKQQKADPSYVRIENESVRQELHEQRWVVAEPNKSQCEILDLGLNGTELTLKGHEIKIDGLGVFPRLKRLHISAYNVKQIDLADSRSIEYLGLRHTEVVENVKLSETVKQFVFEDPEDYLRCRSLTVEGKGLEYINTESHSFHLSNDDFCSSMDFTGCPNLKRLNINRDAYGYTSLYTVYVTAVQKKDIDADKIQVKKHWETNFVVKK